MKNKIVLIGFACSYKSSVGKLLSQKLNYRYIDTDSEIERLEQKSVAEILNNNGESYFRALEQKVIEGIEDEASVVVSCGGGTVLSPKFGNLVQDSEVVWLTATVQTVLSRLDGCTRPLFDNMSKTELQVKMDERNAVYKRYASVSVCTDNLTSLQVANKVIDVLQKR